MSLRIAWYDFSFELPDDWEITRYSVAAPSGRFEFNNRHVSLGRISWEPCKRVPDEERILAEYHRRYLKKQDEAEYNRFSGIKTMKIGGFRVGYRHEGEPCQAFLYLPACKKALLWVFPDFSGQRLEEIWKPILESFKPNSGEWRDWSAFGIECSLPAGFEIEKIICRPCDVWFEFQHTKSMQRVDIHRWGLPRELLRESNMEEFIRRVITSQEGRILTAKKSTFRGMESFELTTETRGTRGMDRLFSSYWKGVGRIWHDEVEKRLYAYFQAAPRKVTLIPEEELFPQ